MKTFVANACATVFGLGYLPRNGATLASLATLPFCVVIDLLPVAWRFLFFAAFLTVGAWSAEDFCRRTRTRDSRKVVVDEVCGMLIAAWGVSDPNALVILCVLFRVFDNLKPWPISQVDRYGRGGVSVIVDDVMAGLLARACYVLLLLAVPALRGHLS